MLFSARSEGELLFVKSVEGWVVGTVEIIVAVAERGLRETKGLVLMHLYVCECDMCVSVCDMCVCVCV